jgi:hypothetical protein
MYHGQRLDDFKLLSAFLVRVSSALFEGSIAMYNLQFDSFELCQESINCMVRVIMHRFPLETRAAQAKTPWRDAARLVSQLPKAHQLVATNLYSLRDL